MSAVYGSKIADPGARLAVLLEVALRAQQIAAMAAVHESEAFARRVALGNRLAVEFGELRLVLEQIRAATARRP